MPVKLDTPPVKPVQVDTPPEISAVETPEVTPVAEATTGKISQIEIFTSTFITIFCAELGDKTQVTTLLMSAESHQPWIVFAGAGTALILTSLLGVLVGRWLSKRLSPRTLETASGGILLVIAASLLWDLLQA